MQQLKNFFQHFFTPNGRNNFRAKAIHHDFLTYYLVIALLFVFVVKKGGHFSNVLGFATDISVNKLYELTNKEREKNNLSALQYNDKLAQAAAKKAEDMFQKNYWAHYAPDGKTPWDFILGSDYKYEFAGENLAKNFLFSQAVVDAWMNSPTHRENIVKNEYTEVGFAVVNGILNGEETTLVVQMFGKPLISANAGENTRETIPAVVPQAQAQSVLPAQTKSEIALPAGNRNQKTVSFYGFSWSITAFFLAFLALVFLMDFYFASRLNLFRLHGKNLAHFIFLAFIIIGIYLIIVKSGIIL